MGAEKPNTLTRAPVLKTGGKGGGHDELREILRGKDLFVLIKGATGLKAADGSTGSSDPYCRMKMGEYVSFRTHTIANTVQPEWNETKVVREADLIKLQLEGHKWGIEFGVYDYDGWKNHDKLGKARLDLSSLIDDFKANRRAVCTLLLSKKLAKDPQADSALRTATSTSDLGIIDGGTKAFKTFSKNTVFKLLPKSSGALKESLGSLDVEVWLEDSAEPSDEQNPQGGVTTVLRGRHAGVSTRSICIDEPNYGTLYEEPFVVYYKVSLFAALNLDYHAMSSACKHMALLPNTKRESSYSIAKLRPADSVESSGLGSEVSYVDEEYDETSLLSMGSPDTDNLDSAPSGVYIWIKVVCKGSKFQTRLYSVPKSGNVTIDQSFVFSDVRPVTTDPSVVFALYATSHKRTRGRNIANTDIPLSFMLSQCKKHTDIHSAGAPFPVTFDVDFNPSAGSPFSTSLKAQLQLHAGVADHDLRAQIYGISDILSGFDGHVSLPSQPSTASSLSALDSVAEVASERSLLKFESLPDKPHSQESLKGLAVTRSRSLSDLETSASVTGSTGSTETHGMTTPFRSPEAQPGRHLDALKTLRQRKITRKAGEDIDLDDVPDAQDDGDSEVKPDSPGTSLSPATSKMPGQFGRQAKLRPTREVVPEKLTPPTLSAWIVGLVQLLVVYCKDAIRAFKAGAPAPVHKPPTAVGSISILIRSFEILEAPPGFQLQTPHYHLVLKCGPHWCITQPGRKQSGQIRWEVVLPLYDPTCTMTVLVFASMEPLGAATFGILNQREKSVAIVGRGRLRLPELPINAPSSVVLDLKGFRKGKVECTATVDMRLHLSAPVTSLLQAYIRPSKPNPYYTLGLVSSAAAVNKHWEGIRQKDLLERTILQKKSMDAVLSTGRQKFTMPRIKAHVHRIVQLLNTEQTGRAMNDFHVRVRSWEEPLLTGGVAVGIVMLFKYTNLVLCAGILGLIGWTIYTFIHDPPEPLRIDLELQTMNPTAEDVQSKDDNDEHHIEVPLSNKYKLLKERWDFTMSVMLKVQNVIDDVATTMEKCVMMMTWQDPRVTTLVIIALCLALPALWFVGLSNLAMFGTLWYLRPPSLRSPRPPPPICLFSMLPAKSDLRV